MKIVCIGGAFVRRKGREMRYRRRKLCFLFALFFLIWGTGCREKAELYDSAQEEPVSEESAQSTAAEEEEREEETAPVSVSETQEAQAPEESQSAEAEELLCVYVCGEVASPGVYELPKDARIHDAVSETQEAQAPEESQSAEAEELLCVYVCGEVASPGVYELPKDARIHDALTAAGGMTEEAAPSWLNLAEHAKDGQKIEVPSKEQVRAWEEAGRMPEQDEGLSSGTNKEDTLVNLNTASEQELQTLPGIGEGKAREIVSYRKEHGSFRRIEDLMQIPGIKEGVFSKIRDQITV